MSLIPWTHHPIPRRPRGELRMIYRSTLAPYTVHPACLPSACIIASPLAPLTTLAPDCIRHLHAPTVSPDAFKRLTRPHASQWPRKQPAKIAPEACRHACAVTRAWRTQPCGLPSAAPRPSHSLWLRTSVSTCGRHGQPPSRASATRQAPAHGENSTQHGENKTPHPGLPQQARGPQNLLRMRVRLCLGP